MEKRILLALVTIFMTMVNPGISNQFTVSGGNPVGINQNVDARILTHPEYNFGYLGGGYGETQPILWPKRYGPINISLPARENISYLEHLPYDDEGILAGYAKIGIKFDNQIDLVEKVSKELAVNNKTALSSEINLGKNSYGLPIAAYGWLYDTSSSYGINKEEQVSVGTCRWGPLTLTVTVYGYGINRVKLILNSIKPPESSTSRAMITQQ